MPYNFLCFVSTDSQGTEFTESFQWSDALNPANLLHNRVLMKQKSTPNVYDGRSISLNPQYIF